MEQELAILESGRQVRRLLHEPRQMIRTSFKIGVTKMERLRQIGVKARMFGLICCVREGTKRGERKGFMKKST